jgi:hypothetical protein
MTAKIASVAVVTTAAWVLSTASPLPLYSFPAPGSRDAQGEAPGQPIFDCAGMRATSASLKAGLPRQDEWIRHTEDLLRAAEEGVSQSREALQAIALKGALDLVVHQLETIRQLQNAVDNARGFSLVTRATWMRRIENIEKAAEGVEAAEKLGVAGVAGYDLGTALQKNRATLEDFIKQVQESGIGDELGGKAALLAGPAGALVAETFTVARDVFFAGFQGKMSADAADEHRRALAQMRAVRRAVANHVDELDRILASSDCAAPAAPPRDRITTTPPPEQPKPKAKPTPAAKRGGGPGAGIIIAGAAVAAGVAAAAASKAANTDGSQSSGGNSSCAQYNASAGRCCTVSSGIQFIGYPSPQRCGVPSNTHIGASTNELGEPTYFLLCNACS